ncbi:MAG: hypothetical protein JSW71_18200 [Gemmatimonadota bacterium]|nr:MAG: hypothetical protein JSW71_18200 [Gemmatimonadota bacterium]
MTSAAQPSDAAELSATSIVEGGVKLGLITAVGTAAFALGSRTIDGPAEVAFQSLLVLLGGALFSYLPAIWLKPSNVDSIAWASLVGLLGALTFTVVDTAILRPLGTYHWTWDQIGGGSGFWYTPVWWMGATTLAWLGAWIYGAAAKAGPVNVAALVGRSWMIALVLFAIAGLARVGPFGSAMMALAFGVALVVQGVLATTLLRK